MFRSHYMCILDQRMVKNICVQFVRFQDAYKSNRWEPKAFKYVKKALKERLL